MERRNGEPSAIRLAGAAAQDFAWLTARDVRLIDHRDAIGAERLHTRELEAKLGERTTMPLSISGVCTRSSQGAADILAGAMREAVKLRHRWEAAERSHDQGRGGSVYYRPVAIVLSNYGASVYASEASKRVDYFKG